MLNIIGDQKKFQGECIINFPVSYRYYENSLRGLEIENFWKNGQMVTRYTYIYAL